MQKSMKIVSKYQGNSMERSQLSKKKVTPKKRTLEITGTARSS